MPMVLPCREAWCPNYQPCPEHPILPFGGGQPAPIALRIACGVGGRGDVVRRAVRDMPEYAPGRWDLDRDQFPGPSGDGAVRQPAEQIAGDPRTEKPRFNTC